jgi:hypothetical protein
MLSATEVSASPTIGDGTWIGAGGIAVCEIE